jgi:threonine aldolase
MASVDLRSDTVTRPTPAMRKAIAEAPVGDDVFGDDPTVNALEEKVAALFGHEAALFVPSGTMGNQICIACHTEPGDEILFESGAHIFHYEVGAPAVLSGVLTHPIVGRRGVITAADVKSRIRPIDVHCPRTRLVALENTHNRAGGTVFPLDEIKQLYALTREAGLRMHLDGARIWNAHVATGIPLAEYGRYFDSISACFSKGLGCPVGSVVIGSRAFIEKADRARKRFGGGMRQVGILAAAAIHALDHHIARMREDHDNARYLATELAGLPGIAIDLEAVQTNMVFMDVADTGRSAAQVATDLARHDVWTIDLDWTRLRCVTHMDVSREDCQRAVGVIRTVVGEYRR